MSSSAALDTPAAAPTLAEQQTQNGVQQDVSSTSQQASSCTPPALDFGAQDAASTSTSASTARPRVFKMSDEFLMFKFKIEMCSRKDRCVGPVDSWRLSAVPSKLSPNMCLHACSCCCRHDWKICPYAHPGEVARRRHPRGYTAVLCPAKTAVRAFGLTTPPQPCWSSQRGLAQHRVVSSCTRDHGSLSWCAERLWLMCASSCVMT